MNIKKLFKGFITLAMLANMALPLSSLQVLAVDSPSITQKQSTIPVQLEKDLKDSIKFIYGEKKLDEIYANINKLIVKAKEQRDPRLLQDDLNRDSDWYKDEIVYMFYADQFGVNNKNSTNTFKDLIGMLDYLEDLGVTAIYILPFMDSPMGDAGFDVRDPKNIRADLGGMKEFKEFANEARKRGFKIKSDLILNHFSDQHQWFQQALAGDESKLDYFIHTDKMPEYRKYRDESVGIVVEYKEDDGSLSKRRLIFPDICENNYRKVTINGKDHYFYHTFYPFQLDINWDNPEVLYYVLDSISFWGNLGIDIFRMDAIPYFIKEKGTNAENLPKTHQIVKLLSAYNQAVSPRSIVQAEACQWPKDILPYFGKEREVNYKILGKEKKITRTDEVQIAYHFPYMPAIWASLLTEDSEHFWKAYAQTPGIPPSAAWALFLRVHDELTLEMVDIETRKLIYDKLAPKGAEFREGFGVSGRIANFLNNNPDKIASAFSVLLSLPGMPIIYYGDEIGAQNNWEYAKNSAKTREETQKAKGDDLEVKSYFDSRDINRGPLLKNSLYDAMKNTDSFSSKVYKKVKNLIRARKQNPIITRGEFVKLDSNKKEAFAFLRQYKDENVLIAHNLSDKKIKAEIEIPFNIKDAKKVEVVDLLTGKKFKVKLKAEDTFKIKLKPYQSVWLKF